MTSESVIMVQVADRAWTMAALERACQLAREKSARIALVKMIPVQHTEWLGTECGYLDFTYRQQVEFARYQAIIEDHGVAFAAVVMQYVTLSEAIVQAADHVDATIVIATLPTSVIPSWTRFHRWLLARRLAGQQRQWIEYPTPHLQPRKPSLAAVAQTSRP